MARTPATFKQADLARAVKTARNSGFEIGRIEITREGRIVLVNKQQAAGETPDALLNDWLAGHNARAS